MPNSLVLEIFAAVTGLSGALLLATKSRFSPVAWPIWMLSNAGWVLFGLAQQHMWIVAQNAGFFVTSAIGCWTWLIGPWLDRERAVDYEYQALLEAVSDDGRTMRFVPWHYRTAELCATAVRSRGQALQFVPTPLRTAALCLAAVQQSRDAMRWVPSQLHAEVVARLTDLEEQGSVGGAQRPVPAPAP